MPVAAGGRREARQRPSQRLCKGWEGHMVVGSEGSSPSRLMEGRKMGPFRQVAGELPFSSYWFSHPTLYSLYPNLIEL